MDVFAGVSIFYHEQNVKEHEKKHPCGLEVD
jgi:hypothetical protein